jgi:hypothetical protein
MICEGTAYHPLPFGLQLQSKQGTMVMKLKVTALSAALLLSSAGLALAQSGGSNSPPQGGKSDDCMPGHVESMDNAAINQSLRCRVEEKQGTDTSMNGADSDVTGSTTPAPQRKHNMNDDVPEAAQP